jgi:hypothetical protein
MAMPTTVTINSTTVQTLHGLDKDAAIELLERLAPQVVLADSEQALLLAQELEYVPLTLHVAGRILQLENLVGSSCARRETGRLLAAAGPITHSDDEPVSVRAVLERRKRWRQGKRRLVKHTVRTLIARPAFVDEFAVFVEAGTAWLDQRVDDALWESASS